MPKEHDDDGELAKADSGPAAAPDARSYIDRLRNEDFNLETEKRLESHPYVLAAESGSISHAQLRAFATEQYAIQLSDATSFATLAGHVGFAPSSLVGITTPEPVPTVAAVKATATHPPPPDLFQFLLGGEIYAAPLLLAFADQLGLGEEALKSAHRSAVAQAYPSYWSRLALGKKRAAGAAACAVNFPAWGRMCGRLAEALAKYEDLGFSDKKSLAFIEFFGSPIESLDDMAASIIEEEGSSYEELLEPVRLLQEYEVMFWDACYSAE
uniref:Thiaminase-2/PQQC domain-containing protein n=1 Tax=Pseudictyota dubia TaxID=2749911 RepID=A0A7R9W6J9_9STRA|mmetsp:Transcript_36115/g.66642  ORF Transcript_36115/g.66642 Transcript_36115/m.66642 type:complete len:269 (+) Transcript_36115:113-919(+)